MTLSRKDSRKLAASLKKDFNKFADIMDISACKLAPPEKGYGIRIEVNGDTSWDYVGEVRDAARKTAGENVRWNVILTDKYPPKTKTPKPS